MWKILSQSKIAGLPVLLWVAGAFGLLLILIGLILPRNQGPIDINSPDIFNQIPTGQPLKHVTAQQIIDYVRTHGVTTSDVKPYKSSLIKSTDALSLNVQGRPVMILSYSDPNILLQDSSLFLSDQSSISAVSSNSSASTATLAAPTARPTNAPLSARWNVDRLGNVILLTDKNMEPKLRSALRSHLSTLIIAPVRPEYPTLTP